MDGLFVCLFWLWCMNNRLGITWEAEQKPWWRAYKTCTCRGKKSLQPDLSASLTYSAVKNGLSLTFVSWSWHKSYLHLSLTSHILTSPHYSFLYSPSLSLSFILNTMCMCGGESVCEYWVFIFHIYFFALLDQQAVQWSRVLSLTRKANCFVTEMTSNKQVKWGFH